MNATGASGTNTGAAERSELRSGPVLSVLVIAYNMARQAENTLYTLSTAFQRDVAERDYEIVVVENASERNLDPGRVSALGANIRYLRRQEAGVSPAAAVNFGLARCRGRLIGLMIDGARMVTPRVVRYVLDAWRITEDALVAVPGYHLGPAEHHENVDAGYDEEAEKALLAQVDWRQDGYQLFSIACLSGANARGIFHPVMESNCMFASAENFRRIGGADERFQLPGGGALNLHMFRQLGLLPGIQYFLLPGEGSFHQFHRGVTTAQTAERARIIERQREQLQGLWDGPCHSLRREPALLGAVTGWALPFLGQSVEAGLRRFRRFRNTGQPEWPDELPDGGRSDPSLGACSEKLAQN